MLLQKIVFLLLLVGLGVGGSAPLLSSNYDPNAVNEYTLISAPLEVPLSLPRNSDPRPPTPIHQKYNLRHHSLKQPNLNISGLQPRMVYQDYVLLYQHQPSTSFFQEKHPENYHLLESLEFVVTISNPSEIFTICLNQIFSDCESVTKSLRRPLPFCINPYTKYPLHFNLYVTAVKNRELIKSAIFFNATILYQQQVVLNRIWMKEVKFNLLPNHLKLYALELRNCKQDASIVSLKNPQKQDITLMIEYKYKKVYMDHQPLDSKIIIGAGKIFRFLIEGRDATMTIYTYNNEIPTKIYPPLYLPLYCLDPLTIEHIPVGILSAPNLALSYPLVVTSHTSQLLHIQQISLHSSSQAVELISLPTHKLVIHANQKIVQVASFIVRAAANPSAKNTISIQLTYQAQNSSTSSQIKRTFFYSELYDIVKISSNRFYQLSKIKDKQYNDSEKIKYFNYSITNHMQIPIRLERILFNPQQFRMQWYLYTGTYVHPDKVKEEIWIQYIGNKNIPISPVKYAAAIELSGGMLIPFETMIYDNTLICKYKGREDRCSRLKSINFGYQKVEQKNQIQTVTIINLNPTNITLTLQPYSMPPQSNIQLTISVGKPFPYYAGAIIHEANSATIELRSGHAINLTFQVKVNKTIIGDMMLAISTNYEQIAFHLRFHFQTGKLLFSPKTTTIDKFDKIYRGLINLTSTFHQRYSIKQIITDSPKLLFHYNESEDHDYNKTIAIPFTYNPFDSHNLTTQCCGEEFILSKYLNPLIKGEEQTEEVHQITLITSSEIETKAKIKIQPEKTDLISNNKQINLNVLKAHHGGTLCINIHNPYEHPLKYSVALLPNIVVDRPKDFFTYLKYAKRQKVDTYFCTREGKNSQVINANLIKDIFKLQEKPTELLLRKDGTFTDKTLAEKNNLSNNDYLNSFSQTGKENCYKFSSILYFKLLIESEIINDILDNYPLEYIKRFVQKQHIYVGESAFTAIYDDYYDSLQLNYEKYCHSAVYPIFRFCQILPLKNLIPNFNIEHSRRLKKYLRNNSSRIIPENSSEDVCYLVNSATNTKDLSFYMLIANNHSKFDEYHLNVNLVQPKIKVGDISFQENHNINHTTFIKHYFSALYQTINSNHTTTLIKDHGITENNKIIPVYFTNEDYDDKFGVFKGSRYFELSNQAPVDVQFTHYGFGNIENIKIFQGFSIEQVGVPSGVLKLPANSKSTFKIDFQVDHTFNINFTNPLFHHTLTLYLYKSTYYHIQLHLVIKIADNIVAKIKAKQQQKHYQSSSPYGYILLNLISFSYICAVIGQLRKEEDQKKRKLTLLKDKLNKIEGLLGLFSLKPKQDNDQHPPQERPKKQKYILPSSNPQSESQYKISGSISQEDLAFFKTLKIKEDKSVISESSEILSHDQFEKLKIDEEEKSQKSGQKSQTEEVKLETQELSQSKTDNFDEEDDNSSELDGSQHSLTESMLPDGISVCNELDIDQDMDFQFGFEKEKEKPKEKIQRKNPSQNAAVFEYKWFESQNPLKKDKDPFPWMAHNQKKKSKHSKHRKEQ